MTKLSLLGVALLGLTIFLGGCGDSGRDRPASYKIQARSDWPKTVDEKEVAGFLESAWSAPVGPSISVSTRLASETGSPMANAQLAQIQTSKLPGYHERGIQRIRLDGRPAVRWAFDVPKEESFYDLFFEECETAFIVRGALGGSVYSSYTRTFRDMASTIKADCDE